MDRLQILLVHPATGRFPGGNRVTALRWASHLRGLGHQVEVRERYQKNEADLMLALHATKCGQDVLDFRRDHATKPIIVGLAGTDLYGEGADEALLGQVLACATRCVALQPEALDALPESFKEKGRVIHQSVAVPHDLERKRATGFQVALIAHLRDIKDPLLPARASRLLPVTSKVRVVHIGRALDAAYGEEAELEAAQNPRYLWLGERPRSEVLHTLAASHLAVSSSRHEGGANVVSEAIAVGTAVIATRIPGNTGLLGRDYPGLFPAGDAKALADLLLRAESDAEFLANLEAAVAEKAWLFEPERERQAWRALLAEIL